MSCKLAEKTKEHAIYQNSMNEVCSFFLNIFCIFVSTAGKFKPNSTIKAFHAEVLAGTQAVPQPTEVCNTWSC
jgi:hypothetical protein